MSNTHDLLDVEDDDARQHRILSMLQRTDAATAATRTPRPSPTVFLPSPQTPPHPIPISDLISRAEAFLPRLAASNADLLQRAALDPASVDIEHLANEDQHIEMNLGLGVFEQRPRSTAPQTTESHHPSSASDSESSESSSSSPSSSDPSSSDDLDSDSSSDASSDDPLDAPSQNQSQSQSKTIKNKLQVHTPPTTQ